MINMKKVSYLPAKIFFDNYSRILNGFCVHGESVFFFFFFFFFFCFFFFFFFFFFFLRGRNAFVAD